MQLYNGVAISRIFEDSLICPFGPSKRSNKMPWNFWPDSWTDWENSRLEIWYLHAPDRTTPYEVTLKAVNDLYKEGKFKRFGISNYMACVSLYNHVNYVWKLIGPSVGRLPKWLVYAELTDTFSQRLTKGFTTRFTGGVPKVSILLVW